PKIRPITSRLKPHTSPPDPMKVIKIATALRGLKKLNDEIRYVDCFADKQFTAGLITFRPSKNSNRKQINHADKDVVCHVIKGSGRLRVNGKRISLEPGTICHIPKGTPHDFASGKGGDLVLFYSLIKTA
ncbi:MAG TPA: cupin domain-containing protein, partial [Candidatus Binatia bacterium]|nr:cupin domain-containing protein [Candidatus Binatia bacterium]